MSLRSYDTIPEHLKPFVVQAIYESSSSSQRDYLIDYATSLYDMTGAPSVIYPSPPSRYVTPSELFEGRMMTSIGGIQHHRYQVRDDSREIHRSEMALAIQQTMMEFGERTVNITLRYVDTGDRVRWISFSQRDISALGFEGCLKHLESGVHQWDPQYYHGSDDELRFMKTSSLSTHVFDLLVRSPVTGGHAVNKTKYTHYNVYNIASTDNDCLVKCFKLVSQKTVYTSMTGKAIRELLNFPLQGELGLEHVEGLEQLFQVKVKIVADRRSEKSVKHRDGTSSTKTTETVLYQSKGIRGWDFKKLIFEDHHFDVVVSRKKVTEVETSLQIVPSASTVPSDSDSATKFLFFDYETTYNPVTMDLEVYAWALVTCDASGRVLEREVRLDNDFVSYLTQKSIVGKAYLIGFNNSRFDNFLLIDELIVQGLKPVQSLIANNSFLTFQCENYVVRDLCRILCCPLKLACESFRCQLSKLAFDHAEVQQHRNDGKLAEFINDNASKIQAYVLRDCEALSELFFKTRDAVETLTGYEIEECSTIAGMSYRAFKASLADQPDLPIVKNNTIDDFIRKCIIGGRTQVQPGEYHHLSSIDVTSLYPFVMLENAFPIGQPQACKGYQEGKIGVYRVKVLQQPHPRVIPNRMDQQHGLRLDWEAQGGVECILNSVDIDCLKRHGGSVEVYEGYYWKRSARNLFQPYFTNLISEKKRQDELKDQHDSRYNPALRELCKLMMNALSGKLAQRKYDKESELITDKHSLKAFEKKIAVNTMVVYPGKNYFMAQGKKLRVTANNPVIWGTLIYAYARSYMYDTVLSKVKVYGMDTDSAFIDTKALVEVSHLCGNHFGQFKVETVDHSAILVAPKCYVFYQGDTIIKQRFKGINVHRDKVWVHSEEAFASKDITFIHDYYFDDQHKITVDTYRVMLTKTVLFLTSSLNKRLNVANKPPLNLRQRFAIKKVDCET